MKLPEISDTILKAISLVIFLLCVALEVSAWMVVYNNKREHCIRGFELTLEVGMQIFFTAGVVLSDIIYCVLIAIAMAIPKCNYGADYTTISYNVVAAIMCLGSIVLLARRVRCGNVAFLKIQDAICLNFLASFVLHMGNGLFCLAFLSSSEKKLD